jgi:hypothetical protein
MSWRIFWRNFVRAGAGFCRMALNGGRLAAILGLATRSVVIIFRSQLAHVLGAIFTGVQVAGGIFRECAGSNVQLHVWPVAARIMAENSMRVFGCGL